LKHTDIDFSSVLIGSYERAHEYTSGLYGFSEIQRNTAIDVLFDSLHTRRDD